MNFQYVNGKLVDLDNIDATRAGLAAQGELNTGGFTRQDGTAGDYVMNPSASGPGADPMGGFTMGGFLGGVDALAKLGNVGVGLANYGLAKDAYKFNVMNANRNYEADKTKYNNALARTEAVNAVYGSPNVATKL